MRGGFFLALEHCESAALAMWLDLEVGESFEADVVAMDGLNHTRCGQQLVRHLDVAQVDV